MKNYCSVFLESTLKQHKSQIVPEAVMSFAVVNIKGAWSLAKTRKNFLIDLSKEKIKKNNFKIILISCFNKLLKSFSTTFLKARAILDYTI